MAKLCPGSTRIYDGIIEIKASRATPAAAPRSRSSRATAASAGRRRGGAAAASGRRRRCRAKRSTSSVVAGPGDVCRQRLADRGHQGRHGRGQRRIEVWSPTTSSASRSAVAAEVRLASQLTGRDIDILTEAESRNAAREFHPPAPSTPSTSTTDRPSAGNRGPGGGRSPVSIWPRSRASTISGRVAETRARRLERRDEEYQNRVRELGVADELVGLEGLTPGCWLPSARTTSRPSIFAPAGDEHRNARRLRQGRVSSKRTTPTR